MRLELKRCLVGGCIAALFSATSSLAWAQQIPSDEDNYDFDTVENSQSERQNSDRYSGRSNRDYDFDTRDFDNRAFDERNIDTYNFKDRSDERQRDFGRQDRPSDDRLDGDREFESRHGQKQRDQRREMQDDQQKRRSSDRQSRFRLSPTGWVRIATDYDRDGRFDAMETLYFYDLERARQTSRERTRQQARGGDAEQWSSRSQQRDTQSQQQQASLTGKINEIRKEEFAGMDDEFTVARIQNEQGRTAKVCLGKSSQLSKLDLREGDRVTVQGVRGRINDKSMLIAREIHAGEKKVSIDMPAARQLKRVRGEIASKRTASFRGFDEKHVVAKLKLENGEQALVNLGPQSKLRKLDLQEGDKAALLVRPGRINGQSAMVAEQIRANGELAELPRPQDSKRFPRSGRESDRQQRSFHGSQRSQSRDDQDQARGNRVTYDGRERAALGVTLSDSPERGVEIDRVIADSPAEKAGLQEGDRLISIDGRHTTSYRSAVRTLREHEAGETVEVRISRDGQQQTMDVKLSTRTKVGRG